MSGVERTFEIDDKKYKEVEVCNNFGCHMNGRFCCFADVNYDLGVTVCKNKYIHITGSCSFLDRRDGKSVIFKEVKDV